MRFWMFMDAFGSFKDISHLTIFDISMRPMCEDQRHRRRFTG